ncbi:predicted protein [Botrytis cinerea T4]|uniref:Uncharacterized protein n=1 Tax=Botryotinia fuckeliana (strain T4) TaxID=999810 RepID=G2YRP1_BOTF4|nr:predicted protein [Botrytis cinerea T4]
MGPQQGSTPGVEIEARGRRKGLKRTNSSSSSADIDQPMEIQSHPANAQIMLLQQAISGYVVGWPCHLPCSPPQVR